MQEPAYTPADIRTVADQSGWLRAAAEYPVLLANIETASAWELAIRRCCVAEAELDAAQATLTHLDLCVDALSDRLQLAIDSMG